MLFLYSMDIVKTGHANLIIVYLTYNIEYAIIRLEADIVIERECAL